MAKQKAPLLIIADSNRCANMLYASRIFVPDPFIYLRKGEQVHLVLSDLEIDRARRLRPDATIHSLTALRQKAEQQGYEDPGLGQIASMLLRQLRVRRITVPYNFPLGLANTLQSCLPKLQVRPEIPFRERAIKSPTEIRHLREILKLTQQGILAGIDVLKKSKIRADGLLEFRGECLTSERVRSAIHTVISQNGGMPCNTIVAGGDQACDPHERGFGRLAAHVPIIIDVFPRSETTGYYGDITRTVVRGKASDTLQDMYQAVATAQRTAMAKIRAGQATQPIHQAVESTFESLGFQTKKANGKMTGFFHGTGHGLGLDIHEAPSIGKTSLDTLHANHVVTVEPGLYYPGLGGIRIEDVVKVNRGRPTKLTDLEYRFEI